MSKGKAIRVRVEKFILIGDLDGLLNCEKLKITLNTESDLESKLNQFLYLNLNRLLE